MLLERVADLEAEVERLTGQLADALDAGPVEHLTVADSVRIHLRNLAVSAELSPDQAVLGSIALNLALKLDHPDDGKIVAGVSKELRSVLDALQVSIDGDAGEESPLLGLAGL